MDAKTRKAIHRDIDNSTIPEEIKLMYLAASACQSMVEVVFKRIKVTEHRINLSRLN